jgi:hypothetical protein
MADSLELKNRGFRKSKPGIFKINPENADQSTKYYQPGMTKR